MKLIKRAGQVAAALTLGTIVSACGQNSNAPRNPTESEKTASNAESLITEETFQEAYARFALALVQDPSNVRAHFWKAALGPAMELEGIYARIAPLASQTPQRASEYRKAVANIKAHSNPKMAAFLLNGPADIHTEGDAQEVIARVIARIDTLRETMKDLKSSDLEIDGLPNTKPVKLNSADFEAIQQMVAGYEVYISFLNSYDLSGSWTVAENSKYAPAQDVIASLLSNPQFGKLRDGHYLSMVPQLAKDAVLAGRAALTLQKELCPTGQVSAQNRPGYLFNEGFCVATKDSFEATLKTVELVASNDMVRVVVGEKPKEYMVSAPKYFASPITDLRQVVPTGFDRCGQVTQIADPTIGGLFPRGEIAQDITDGLKPCNQ